MRWIKSTVINTDILLSQTEDLSLQQSICSISTLVTAISLLERASHWRQRRRGCRGHIPTNILVGGGTSKGISPPILLHTFGHNRPILVALRLRSSRFPSAIRCRQFASVRQADSGLTYCIGCSSALMSARRPASCSYSLPVTCTGRRRVTVIQTVTQWQSLADTLCLWTPRRRWWSGTLT